MEINGLKAVTENEYLDFLTELRNYASFNHTERDFNDNTQEFNTLAQVINTGCRIGVTCAEIQYKPIKTWFINKQLLQG